MIDQGPMVEIALALPNGGRIAPGDIRLVEAIRQHRSIIRAGRALGISYRKCWLTVDGLNRMFETPVIATHPGRKQGGAELTPFGERLVALYRSIERRSAAGAAAALGELAAAADPGFTAQHHSPKSPLVRQHR
ncbi:winged helix-turn-helix domain-containing protein [Methylobacterium sp. ID0610]|uniref:winged helix-turn-helix domain-containing protein n=1 Tax=Methylobacterium carpenticola TaxID=3344827 RepID=UPI0036BA0F8C